MNTATKKIAVAAAVIAALSGALLLLHRTGSGSALERYKAELESKGEKLTFRELAVPPSTNELEIACRRALDVYSNWMAGSSAAPGAIPELMEFVGPGKARIAWRGQLHVDDLSSGAAANWEILERQNESAATILSPVISALVNPNPDTGWIYKDTFSNCMAGPPRTFVRDRSLARALVRAEMGELHRGNFDEAHKDLRAVIGMTQVNRNELTLVHQIIRAAIGQLALPATWEALQAPGWNEPRLASIQEDWERVNFFDGLERAFLAERAHTEILMVWVREEHDANMGSILHPAASGNAPTSARATFEAFLKTIPFRLYRLTGGPNEDEMFQLAHYEEALGLARDLETNRPWPEVSARVTNIIAGIERAIAKDRLHRLYISAIAIPNFSGAFRTVVRAETLRRLAITAIALKRYELRNGRPPGNLAVLAPEFLRDVPIDPMSGKPLCYRVNADGTFILYSTGEDGKDDGGNPAPATAGGLSGLWEGRDAVWPSAASDEEVAKEEAKAAKKPE